MILESSSIKQWAFISNFVTQESRSSWLQWRLGGNCTVNSIDWLERREPLQPDLVLHLSACLWASLQGCPLEGHLKWASVCFTDRALRREDQGLQNSLGTVFKPSLHLLLPQSKSNKRKYSSSAHSGREGILHQGVRTTGRHFRLSSQILLLF